MNASGALAVVKKESSMAKEGPGPTAADYGSTERRKATITSARPHECVLDHPFRPLGPAAFASHAAVVGVTEAGCAGRTTGVHEGYPPCRVASPHADNLPESAR